MAWHNKLEKDKVHNKNSHTCKQGGTNLRISFWQLMVNLKSKYLLKKLLKWANKKQNNFNIYNVTFFLKKNFTPVYQKSQWHDLQFLKFRAWQTEISNFRSLFTLLSAWKPKKLKFFKKEKNCWRYHHFTNVYQKSQWYDIQFLRNGVRQTLFFCHFGPFFALYPLPP